MTKDQWERIGERIFALEDAAQAHGRAFARHERIDSYEAVRMARRELIAAIEQLEPEPAA